MERRSAKAFRERTIRDEAFGELRPHAPLIEVVSGNLAPRGRALNIECGRGLDSMYMAQEGFAVAAVGFLPEHVIEVERRAEEAGAKVETFTVEPGDLPFHEGEFDFIADASGCVHGMDVGERTALLGELFRTLRRGGRMFIMLPSYVDQPGGVTRGMIDEMFHPPFEVIRVIQTSREKLGGPAPSEFLYFYGVLLEKA